MISGANSSLFFSLQTTEKIICYKLAKYRTSVCKKTNIYIMKKRKKNLPKVYNKCCTLIECQLTCVAINPKFQTLSLIMIISASLIRFLIQLMKEKATNAFSTNQNVFLILLTKIRTKIFNMCRYDTNTLSLPKHRLKLTSS